jgi:UDP-N-acetylglucosamine/UDP-N-acetylgalactosamine diphosphorylase
MVDLDRLKQRYEAANQSHVFAAISGNEEIEFLQELESIPVDKLASYMQVAREHTTNTDVSPFPMAEVSIDDTAKRNEYEEAGLKLIRDQKIAAVILGGGQGTRLGFDGPKGCFDIGLPSRSTLFKLVCARIKDLEATIPLVVMTAPHNDPETRAYFEQHENFGLSSVQFCVQGMLPCLTDGDSDNKIILETPTKVAMAPDGNGGIYQALHKYCRDLLDSVDYIHVFSIDNALILPCDPVFIGYAHLHSCLIANKCVEKTDPHEKVGVMGLGHRDGETRPCVVEYSELSKEMAESINDVTGKLEYCAANICNHLYRTDFVKNVVLSVEPTFHLAHKKIPYWNGTATVTPTSNNGYKLEQFIFDVFALCPVDRMKNFLVDRGDEFAAVKNESGNDSPETALIALSERNKAWLTAAGAIVSGEGLCEILHSCRPKLLTQRYAGVEIICPIVLS